MNKFIIFLIIAIIIGAIFGILFYSYYKYEKPLAETKIIYRDVNIKVIDSITNKNIISNFNIGLNSKDNVYYNGITNLGGYSLVKLPTNTTFFIYSNFSNTSYYEDFKSINTYETGPFRIDLNLIPRGNLSFTYNEQFGSNPDFNLILNKEGKLKDLDFCYVYSTKIILLSNNNSLQLINTPLDYQYYYKCFSLPEFNNTITLNFNYIYFGNLDKYDYIDFIFFDNDATNIHKEFSYNVTI